MSKELFKESFQSSNKIYLFEVKESSDGIKYLIISENERFKESNYEGNQIVY